MSLLLDALRKSEDRRRAGQPPGLDLKSRGEERPGRPARRWLPAAAAGVGVLAAAVAASWWWLERPAPPEASPPQASAPAPMPAETAAVARTRESAPAPAAEPSRSSEIVREPESGAAPSMPPDAARVAAVDAPEEAPEPSAGEAESPPVPAEEIDAVLARAGGQPEPPAEPGDSEGVAAAAQPEPARPPAREYMDPWELPLNVRQQLPALNLTIHVYAPRSEDRFVLINGERWQEGDQVASGVVLREIRREGAVMDFREYRFLLR